jgi:glycerol-3-phosphate acyltransferase PlsY
MGLSDPRTFGSKNPGATNVLRSGNKLAAVRDLAARCCQGLAAGGAGPAGSAGPSAWSRRIGHGGAGRFAGRLYPVFFRFAGGKGVRHGAGRADRHPSAAGIRPARSTWLFVAWFFRYSSLAALVAAVLAPVYYILAMAWRGTWKNRYCWRCPS